MKLLLENWKAFLTEEAIDDLSDMGLYFEDNFIVIYKAVPVLSKIRKAVYEDPDKYDISGDIIGVVRLGIRGGGPTPSSMTVEEIWAVKGYGPTLYRLALEKSDHYGLSPSRIRGEVSDQASNVWYNFKDGKGQQYASFEAFEQPIHGVEHLDGVYHSQGPQVNKTKALANHNRIFNSRRDPYDEMITHFIEEADSLLRSKVQL